MVPRLVVIDGHECGIPSFDKYGYVCGSVSANHHCWRPRRRLVPSLFEPSDLRETAKVSEWRSNHDAKFKQIKIHLSMNVVENSVDRFDRYVTVISTHVTKWPLSVPLMI